MQLEKLERGNVNVMGLAVAAIGLVVTAIVISVGLTIMGSYQTSLTVNSSAYNATGEAGEGITALAQQLPTIGLVIAAAAVIGILFGAFAYLMAKRE
jgi:hypothetical protein